MKNKTLSSLILATALLTLGACSKDNDDSPEPRWTVNPALLPVPSCDDTSDDGRFEIWNSTEDLLVFQYFKPVLPNDTFLPGYMSDFRIANRRISLNTPNIYWSAGIDTTIDLFVTFTLVDRPSGRVESVSHEGLIWNRRDPVSKRLAVSSQLRLDSTVRAGCKRLFFYGANFGPVNKSVTMLLPDHGQVLFRGHFDVELN